MIFFFLTTALVSITVENGSTINLKLFTRFFILSSANLTPRNVS